MHFRRFHLLQHADQEWVKGWRFPTALQPIADRIHARDTAIFHGAVDNKKLNLIEKWMLKNVKAPLGDFRDWNAINAWASAIANAPYTIPFFQNVVIELLDTLAIQRAILIGHSLGAVIAHSVALNYPERVERLILIDGSLVARSQKIDLATMLFLIPGLGEWLYASSVACAAIPRQRIGRLRPIIEAWTNCPKETERSCSSE